MSSHDAADILMYIIGFFMALGVLFVIGWIIAAIFGKGSNWFMFWLGH